MSKALLIDVSKCIGCRGCQVACKQWWDLPAVATTNTGSYENPPDLSAETWTRIRFKEVSNTGTVEWLFYKQHCLHCTEAACVKVCPAYARQYTSFGYVAIDQQRCIGCGRCVSYCPFGVPRLGMHNVTPRIVVTVGVPRMVAYNCNFCMDRVENSLTPACAKTCPPRAIQFGERPDMLAQGRARVSALKNIYPAASLYGEHELGGLHVVFVLTHDVALHGLPEKQAAGEYPEFQGQYPGWYTRAIAERQLPAFPDGASREWYLHSPEETEPLVKQTGWLWGWAGLAVGAGAALVSWLIARRARHERGKVKQ